MDSKFTVLNLQSGVLIDNIYINYMRIMRIVRFIRKSVQFRHYPRKPKRDLLVKFDIFCLAIVLLKYLFTVLFVLSIGSN